MTKRNVLILLVVIICLIALYVFFSKDHSLLKEMAPDEMKPKDSLMVQDGLYNYDGPKIEHAGTIQTPNGDYKIGKM